MDPSSKLNIAVTVTLLISGCSYFQSPSETSQAHSPSKPRLISLTEVKCKPMPVTDNQLKFSAKPGQENVSVQLPSGITPFLAYTLPANTQEIEIQSYPLHAGNYEKAEIFYPEAALLDHNNQVLRIINNAKYQRQGIISTESLTSLVRLNHIEDQRAVCLLVYTTDQARSKKTPLMNQTKEYARVRGIVAPPVPDVTARHGDNGDLRFSLKSDDTSPLATAALPTIQQPVSDSFNNAMKSHYLDGIRKAIADKDVKKALALRTEFNNVLHATKGYFVSQFGRDKDKIIEPSAPFEDEGFAGKASYHYQSETYRYLKNGQASSALKLQDSLKHIQQQLDVLFDRQ